MTARHGPAVMPLFRARLAEVRAIDCGDGRHLLLTDPPRYSPSPAFLEAFELVEERRAGPRRQSAGRTRPKAKGERRRTPARRETNGDNPKKAAAKRLFEEGGLKLPAIAKKVNVPYATLYTWSKQWTPASPKKSASADAAGDSRLCTECHQKTPVKGPCNHCGAKP